MNSINWICTQKGKKLCLCSVDSGTHTKTLVCVCWHPAEQSAFQASQLVASASAHQRCARFDMCTHTWRGCVLTVWWLLVWDLVVLLVWLCSGWQAEARSGGLAFTRRIARPVTLLFDWPGACLCLIWESVLNFIKLRFVVKLSNCAALRFVEIHWIWFMIVVVYDGV